jgi:haloalkane dehalogenase
MSDSSKPFAAKKFFEIKGRRMACIDEGQGAPIVFQHGNPTSSYLWRNVMPACRGLGRLIACDLIGMGDSDKLPNSGPDRYTYAEQRDFLFAFWEELKLGNEVIFVLHDWGSALGFDWASQHRDRVQGLAYMEAIVTPMEWRLSRTRPRHVPSLSHSGRRRHGVAQQRLRRTSVTRQHNPSAFQRRNGSL